MTPTDFWDYQTTQLLVQNEWDALNKRNNWNSHNYSTAGYLLDDPQFIPLKKSISGWIGENQIYLELCSQNKLESFFAENELFPIDQKCIKSIDAMKKLDDAMMLLNKVPNLSRYVAQIVRCIVVLKSASSVEDVSYSNPALPFSVFVSVCDERSAVASARVAESILHEAMHLRLTLIQKIVETSNASFEERESYFAPWRQDERPVNGVLHGIFVFRAILEFFKELVAHENNSQVADHCVRRIREISSQLMQVRDFHLSPILSLAGAALARHLVHF